jgi:hypothetical protein
MKTSSYVDQQIASGKWHEETIAPELTGLARPITVFRATRKDNLIVVKWHGDNETFCPPIWSDLAIGSGPCGLGCRSCFLMLTFREMRDPRRHVLYDNGPAFVEAARQWLTDPLQRVPKEMRAGLKALRAAGGDRKSVVVNSLGVGIDRSDSLLYEGVTHHIRNLAPLFGDPVLNPLGHKLVLLTKTANVAPLGEIASEHRKNILVTFSLNPNPICDLWEGLWDDGTMARPLGAAFGSASKTCHRITPSTDARLAAAKQAQDWGYEVRARIDPILTPEDWQAMYAEFVGQARAIGVNFKLWTLGTYRQKNDQLLTWAAKWGLPPMGWQPDANELVHEGTHWHLAQARRREIYATVADLIRAHYPSALIGLCKETHSVRRDLGHCALARTCNCLAGGRA